MKPSKLYEALHALIGERAPLYIWATVSNLSIVFLRSRLNLSGTWRICIVPCVRPSPHVAVIRKDFVERHPFL